MEIKEVDYNSIKELIKSFQKSDKNELEVRLHNNNSNNSSKLIIDHNTFTRVRNYLVFDSKVGGLGLKYDMKTTLDITNREGNIRISIDGKITLKSFG